MSGPIRILAPDVAARIAAGEVIERPVSVVRELLDNAIDAGATRIALEIADGGLALIRVVDDGRGIPPEQIELAFERHATSKIAAMGDLAHVHTLGFRGEALPSIAAAADVEILTRAASEPVGVLAVLVNAVVQRRSARPAPVGTSFAVRDLFARLPARRKFLGTATGEARAIMVLVSHYALAYPAIAFALTSNGRQALRTGGDADLRHAFAAVYGATIAAEMLALDHEESGTRVCGLAGPPSLHRGNRAAISVFVNGRWVQSRPLTFAAVDAYRSQLPVGRHPLAALSISVADEEVDVNVHPAKAEVRFRDERAVARAVRHAVESGVARSSPPMWLPRPAAAVEPQPVTAPAGLLTLRARLEGGSATMALRPPAPLQGTLDVASASPGTPPSPRPHRDILPLLRVVGQMGATYVIAEGPDGMYLVDQHAAHERVVYDRILTRPRSDPATQPLLQPAMLELDAMAAATVEEFREHLEALGLALEPFGDGACLVRAVPAGVADTDIAAGVRSLLEQLQADRRLSDPFARAAATVACHASVRAGTALALEEMRRLLQDLEATATPRTCPHGRPTLVHVGTEVIERQFGRR